MREAAAIFHVEPSMPSISVVVPTYHRPELLKRCLAALLRQTLLHEAFEIVVVDDGHDDETRRLVEGITRHISGIPALRYLRPATGRGPAVARNAGWRAARGELIAFTDDDTVPSPAWLTEGEQALRAHAGWSALCGRVTVPVPGTPTDHARMTQGLASAEFVTANAFVWRSAMEQVGGFDERFTRAWREDSDLQFRLMDTVGPVGRIAQAEVTHPVREAPWGLSLSQQRNTFFDALLYKKHPRRYRERIRPAPPWDYYAIVAFAVLALVGLMAGNPFASGLGIAACLSLVLAFAWRRLNHTSRAPAHVCEMLATSALIPFLSVYWRIRGAIHFRVMFW